jgi:hypothetical protein
LVAVTKGRKEMNREQVMQQAKSIGWIVEPCANPGFLAVRSYKPDTNERMRMGANGEFYTRGADGWMYQVGTIEDIANAVQKEKKKNES